VSRKRRTLDDLLADAQTRILRYSPAEAFAAAQAGALMIDIRSDSDRERDGIIPGSLHIPRTVLEWRTDLDSRSRNPHLGGLDQEIILLCDHGCSTILAAATLSQLGYTNVGDVIGGYAAWSETGLPTRVSLLIDATSVVSGDAPARSVERLRQTARPRSVLHGLCPTLRSLMLACRTTFFGSITNVPRNAEPSTVSTPKRCASSCVVSATTG
jgi:rhodanese-related sulfurtransferase